MRGVARARREAEVRWSGWVMNASWRTFAAKLSSRPAHHHNEGGGLRPEAGSGDGRALRRHVRLGLDRPNHELADPDGREQLGPVDSL